MWLICKKVGPTKDRLKLTLGKKYQSVGHYLNKHDDTIIQSYRVVNDEGLECLYDRTMFFSLEEIRDIKLKNLGL